MFDTFHKYFVFENSRQNSHLILLIKPILHNNDPIMYITEDRFKQTTCIL